MSTPAGLEDLLPPDPHERVASPTNGGRGVGAPPGGLPRQLAALVTEAPIVGQRSDQAHALVAAAVEWGYGDGEVLALALSHAPTTEKYGRRAEAEVDRLLAKLRPDHQHEGRPCDKAGCPNRPRWMSDNGTTRPSRPGVEVTDEPWAR